MGTRVYFKGKKFLADTGYFSEQNLNYVEDQGINAYIPDPNFRKRDPRFETANRHKKSERKFTKEDFKYSKPRGTFICSERNTLSLERRNAETFNER